MSHLPSVHLLPALLTEAPLTGCVAVVIDVLRASTTITTALANGAEAVRPCVDVVSAVGHAGSLEPGTGCLGGERLGQLIEGFDLDNSPRSYTADRIGGKTICFTTTNGTHALLRVATADRVLVGAFVNLSAVAAVLKDETRPIHLVCAGTDGHMTSEDILFAGALTESLLGSEQPDDWTEPIQTRLALDFWRGHGGAPPQILHALRHSRGGQNLLRLGLDADLEFTAQRDRFDIVPEFDAATGLITLAG